MKKLILLSFILSPFCFSQAQSLKVPQPSPSQYLKQDFGLGTIEINYSRPGKKNRKIYGDLVPFETLWRTGANSATTITFSDDVSIGGTKVTAGKYGLLSIPGAGEWTLIISKQTNVTSPSEYDVAQDAARVKVKAKALTETVETFTIQVSDISATQCEIQLLWENMLVGLPVSTEIDSRIMKQIENVIINDNRPYYSAAAYYIDNGKDLNKAVLWLDKAIENNPRGYWIYYRKAIALQKLGKKKEAMEASLKSMQIAKEEQDDTYVRNNQKLQESLK